MSEFDTSNLAYYLNRFDDLNPFEFEEMVAQMLRCKGWTGVELTSRSGDMGRDIIGNDQKGRKTYIEVKQHKNKIGRPIIQKLHSIMITNKVDKGMVVSTSSFTPDAIEYARTTNIKLMGGKKYIETCKYIITKAPRSESLCIPINIGNMLVQAHDLLDLNIFTYPKSASKFIEKSQYQPFIYRPYTIAVATIDQDFQNKSGSFYYHMYYSKAPFIFSETGDYLNEKFADAKLENSIDLKNIERQLNQRDIPFKKEAQPPINRDKLRRFVQRVCTVKRRYRGQNNQVYTRTCKPTLANIDIHAIFKFWQLYTSIELKVDKITHFHVFFKDDKITSFIINNYPTKQRIPKLIRMCQKCKALIFKGALKNKYIVCQGCGMVLCGDCIHDKKWCINCRKKIEYGTRDQKKNKDALKAFKKVFKRWNRFKKPIKLIFLSS